MKSELFVGLWSLTCSLLLFAGIYMCTVIRPEMRTAADGRYMHLWEYGFWASNDLYMIALLIAAGLVIGIWNMVKYVNGKRGF